MMTRNHLIALVGAAAVAAVAACGNSNTTGQSSAVSTTPSTDSSAASATSTTVANSQACSALGGQVGPDRVCTVHSEAEGYTIDMKFPADFPDQEALTTILTTQRDQFVEAVTEPPVRDVAKALDIKPTTYRSGTPDAGTESLVLREYVNVGGAHPTTYYDALNYDLGKKAPIAFDELFKPGADPVAVLDPIVQNELTARLPGASVSANPIGADMYKSFALTDDAVIFFIGQGNWTIEAAGPQEVSVPRSQLTAILA